MASLPIRPGDRRTLDLDQLVEREWLKTHRSIRSFLYQKVGSAELAADLTQETFIRCWKNRDQYDPSRDFMKWAFQVAYSVFIDDWRRPRRPTISIDRLLDEDSLKRGEFTTRLGDPEQILMEREIGEELANSLAKLPSHSRWTLLDLSQGIAYEDIAQLDGISLSTVRSRVHRACKIINRQLKDPRLPKVM